MSVPNSVKKGLDVSNFRVTPETSSKSQGGSYKIEGVLKEGQKSTETTPHKVMSPESESFLRGHFVYVGLFIT